MLLLLVVDVGVGVGVGVDVDVDVDIDIDLCWLFFWRFHFSFCKIEKNVSNFFLQKGKKGKKEKGMIQTKPREPIIIHACF